MSRRATGPPTIALGQEVLAMGDRAKAPASLELTINPALDPSTLAAARIGAEATHDKGRGTSAEAERVA